MGVLRARTGTVGTGLAGCLQQPERGSFVTHAPDSQTPDEIRVLSVKFITAKY